MKKKENINLRLSIEQVNKVYGESTIKPLNALSDIKSDIVSTGIIGLDKALGVGGIRRGSILEIFGGEGAGKTTLALHIAKQFQKINLPILYINSERTLTKETVGSTGIKDDGFYISDTNTLESALDTCIISASGFGIIIVDSLTGLTPKIQLESDIDNIHAGLIARTISNALPVLINAISESKCTVIFINQLREKVGVMFGNPERSTGGRALKYYASARLDVKSIEILKTNGDVIGNRSRVKVVKNKIAAPFKETEFDIIYGHGISTEGDILDRAFEIGIVGRKENFFTYNNSEIGHGKINAVNFLKEHPTECEQIRKQILQNLKLRN